MGMTMVQMMSVLFLLGKAVFAIAFFGVIVVTIASTAIFAFGLFVRFAIVSI
jgi:hypothetical protein